MCQKNPDIAQKEIDMAGTISLTDQLSNQRSSRESRDSRMHQHSNGNNRPKDIKPEDRAGFEQILADHGIKPIEEIDPLARLSMSCPALPLCGLAQTEAERIMPSYIERMRAIMSKLDIGDEEILMRMTGCPNGCARPYMAELAFVGDGPKSYQVWLGGSPVLTRTAWPFKAKMKNEALEETMEPILAMFKSQRQEFEAFGDFCHRVGAEAIEKFSETYKA